MLRKTLDMRLTTNNELPKIDLKRALHTIFFLMYSVDKLKDLIEYQFHQIYMPLYPLFKYHHVLLSLSYHNTNKEEFQVISLLSLPIFLVFILFNKKTPPAMGGIRW